MPRVLRNEGRCASLERLTYIVKAKNAAPLQHIENFIHLKMSVNRNARADHDLLGPHGKIVGVCAPADFDEDIATVPKMKECSPSLAPNT